MSAIQRGASGEDERGGKVAGTAEEIEQGEHIMALVGLGQPISWPGNLSEVSGAPSLSTLATLDAAGEYTAFIFCAREAMTISHVGFKPGTATGSPTIDVRIETVGTDGLPSGTLWATNTNIVTAAVPSNTYLLSALTASASVTKGQMVCVKLAYNSGTSLIIQRLNTFSRRTNLPYEVVNVGTPTKTAISTSMQTVALGSSTSAFYNIPGTFPVSVFSNNAFNNTSSARRGLRFTVPFDCRCVGLRWWNSSSAGDFNAILFDDAGSELGTSSTAFDGDHTGAVIGGGSHDVYFDNAVTLAAGTTYRAAIEPSSATNINISTITLPSTSYQGASPSGDFAHYTTYVASSWTDTATDQVPLMDILIDQLDDGAGGGSGGFPVLGGPFT